MSDPAQAVAWLCLLGVGLAVVRALVAGGLPPTHGRDLLHVGAGSWVLGWPGWHAPGWPLGIVLGTALATLLLPWVARHLAVAGGLHRTLASGQDTWSGIALYTVSFAVFTGLGLLDRALPAGAALLALALGDGLGGVVGLRFGRHRYRVPGAKVKSVEGSVAVAVFAGVGVGIASSALGEPVGLAPLVVAALAAATAEAVAPRSTDNFMLPVAVWAVLRGMP